MKLIFKYLRSYVPAVLICVFCLILQAVCHLSLPTLMSNLVNIGITQTGLEDTVPRSLTLADSHLLEAFLSQEEMEQLDLTVNLFLPSSALPSPETEDYPQVAHQPIVLFPPLEEPVLSQAGELYSTAAYALQLFMADYFPPQEGGSWTVAHLKEIQGPVSQASPETLAAYRARALETSIDTRTSSGISLMATFYRHLGMDVDGMQMGYIFSVGVQMLLLALLGLGLAILASLFASQVSAKVSRDLRRDLFRKVQSFSSAEFNQFSTASLITRTTNDVEQIQSVVYMGLRLLSYALIMGLGGIIFAIQTSPELSWVVATAVGALIVAAVIIFFIAIPLFKNLQTTLDRLNLMAREALTGLWVVRAFGNEAHEEARFDKGNRKLTGINRFIQWAIALVVPAGTIIMNLLLLLIVWIGSDFIASAGFQVGNLMAFLEYITQVMGSFLMLAVLLIMMPRAAVSAQRMGEVLSTQPKIKDPETPAPLERPQGVLAFHNVSYRYEDTGEYVLKDISFTARPGETTAFIGSTGAGKSTLIGLIPRFDDVTEGSITLDGVDIRELPLDQLRGAIGYIPQKGVLFSGDIASNLRYGKGDATKEEMDAAIAVAQAKDFVDASENGLETAISQGGANVSGGQKQRLSIARALMKQAPVYIFDDSFSALDFATDAALRKALKASTGHSAVLIVAQRINTILHADQIVVIDQGTVVGAGSHKTLLNTCPVYREIAESQLTKEELQCQDQ